MNAKPQDKGPLKGIRVLELTTMITGPLAGQMLADMGSDNIKVENPKGGDLFRTFRGGSYSPYFCAYNRNKRSIAVDLRSEAGKDVVMELVGWADVLIENFRPGVMDRLGLDYETVAKRNPNLIYCSITGFGPTGPYKDRPAYDAVAQALSGISSLFLDDKAGIPQITGPTITDNMTGINACYGILAALVERSRTNKGKLVEVNMLDSGIAFMPDPFLVSTLLNIEPSPISRVQASQSYALKCADDKMIAVHMSSQEKFWQAVQKALGREDLGKDQRFDERTRRMDNYLELLAEFNKTARTKPRDYWLERFVENDVPHAPVNTLDEVQKDAQVKHLDSFAEISHPNHGSFTAVKRPVWYDHSREDQPLKPPPDLNENAREILSDLGWDEARIEDYLNSVEISERA